MSINWRVQATSILGANHRKGLLIHMAKHMVVRNDGSQSEIVVAPDPMN